MTIHNHLEHVKFKLLAPARVDVRESGEVVLTCSATGSPAPVVAWYKDELFAYHKPDKDIMETGSSSLGETVARLRLRCISAEGRHPKKNNCIKSEIGIIYLPPSLPT